MKRLAALAATGLLGMLPSIASARPHFFFGFGLPFFPAPIPVVVAPPIVAAAPVVVAPPVIVADAAPAPIEVAPAPVCVDPPTVVYVPAPVVRYYDYHYHYATPYRYGHGYYGRFHHGR